MNGTKHTQPEKIKESSATGWFRQRLAILSRGQWLVLTLSVFVLAFILINIMPSAPPQNVNSSYIAEQKLPTVLGEFKSRFSAEQISAILSARGKSNQGDNPINWFNVDFTDNNGAINIVWQDGQILNATMTVSADEKKLELSLDQNGEEKFTSADLLPQAQSLVDELLADFFSDQTLVKLDIESGALDAYFKLKQN